MNDGGKPEKTRREEALRWIAGNGNLVDAPFPDSEIADLFESLAGLIRHHNNRWILTSDGWRVLAH